MRLPLSLTKILAVALSLAVSVLATAPEEPNLTKEQMKQFLLTANVVGSKPVGESAQRLTLSDGKLTHDAMFQWDTASFKHRVGAYILAEMIGFDNMMPVTVERNWQGKSGALSWWLPLKMRESERLQRKIEPPDLEAWNRQMHKVEVFDELVYEADPISMMVWIDEKWRIRRIDFTNAFQLHRNLKDPKNLVRCDRKLFENLKKLDRVELERKAKPYLTKPQVQAVLARRDKIVALFQQLIAEKGESEVLY